LATGERSNAGGLAHESGADPKCIIAKRIGQVMQELAKSIIEKVARSSGAAWRLTGLPQPGQNPPMPTIHAG
jgi:hypothetical protein